MSNRGGKREGSGRPRVRLLEVVTATEASKVKPPRLAPGTPVFEPPPMVEEAVNVWRMLAPHAMKQGTLTEDSIEDFRATCELFVEQRRAARALAQLTPMTPEWMNGSRLYLAYSKDLKLALRAFRLAPNGLPLVEEEKQEQPKSALDKLRGIRSA